MSEAEFWLKLWKYFLGTGTILAVTLMGNCQVTNLHIVRAIEAGASPMEARCALASSDGPSAACYLLADD